MNKNPNGFSLIELLIVIVVISIIAAIAVPGMLSSRRSANEGSAISTMRVLHGAQMTYATSYGVGEFAGNIGSGTTTGLSLLAGFSLIDNIVGGGTKSGYNFVGGREVSSATAPAQFFFSAIPISANSLTGTGNHRFGLATDGVMRSDSTITVQYANTAEVMLAPPMN